TTTPPPTPTPRPWPATPAPTRLCESPLAPLTSRCPHAAPTTPPDPNTPPRRATLQPTPDPPPATEQTRRLSPCGSTRRPGWRTRMPTTRPDRTEPAPRATTATGEQEPTSHTPPTNPKNQEGDRRPISTPAPPMNSHPAKRRSQRAVLKPQG